MRFRHKPTIVEAEQFLWQRNEPDGVKTQLLGNGQFQWIIDTLEGPHLVCNGDWIITGTHGEKYPCKPDIFEASYEQFPDEEG